MYFASYSLGFLVGSFYYGGYIFSKATEIKNDKSQQRLLIMALCFMVLSFINFNKNTNIMLFERMVEKYCLQRPNDATCQNIYDNLYILHNSPIGGG